jgi:hypothetical protein
MTEESHLVVNIGEETTITNPGLQLTVNLKVGDDCFPALKSKLASQGFGEPEEIVIAIVKTFATFEAASKVKKLLEESKLIPEDLKIFFGSIKQDGNKILISISLSSLGMMPSMLVQGFIAKFAFITNLSQEVEFKLRIAPKLNDLFNSLKGGKISCLGGSFLKFIAKLHPNLNKAIYNTLKANGKKGKILLGYIALIFKSLKIDLNINPNNDAEFSSLMAAFGIPTEMIAMVPNMIEPLIEGELKEILTQLDGPLSIMLGTSKAVAEIGIEINGIKDLLALF